MTRIDTNYIIRYFINDNIEMANVAEKVLSTQDVFIANEIIAEVIYVLEGVYEVSKENIVDLLLELIDFENVYVLDEKILKKALVYFKEKNLDFVDCLLCAYSQKDEILTFDKKLKKCIKS
jgi:predicted nucleic-acid-binding protein